MVVLTIAPYLSDLELRQACGLSKKVSSTSVIFYVYAAIAKAGWNQPLHKSFEEMKNSCTKLKRTFLLQHFREKKDF